MSEGILRPIVGLLAGLPELADLIGNLSDTVSVPEAARPYVLAGLTELGGPGRTVVVTPTAAEAERQKGGE